MTSDDACDPVLLPNILFDSDFGLYTGLRESVVIASRSTHRVDPKRSLEFEEDQQ